MSLYKIITENSRDRNTQFDINVISDWWKFVTGFNAPRVSSDGLVIEDLQAISIVMYGGPYMNCLNDTEWRQLVALASKIKHHWKSQATASPINGKFVSAIKHSHDFQF